jgi:hypothetical protein
MDANAYEYQSYTIIRRRMKDRGALHVHVQRGAEATGKLHLSVMSRREYRLRRGLACAHALLLALPVPAAEQDKV